MPEKYNVTDIKNSHPIEVEVGKVVDLKQNGKEFEGLCPFHTEKTPSFSVSPEKRMYYCFGCATGGDVLDFVQNYYAIKFVEACAMLDGKKETPGKRATPKQVEKFEDTTYKDIDIVMPVPSEAPPLVAGEKTSVYNPKREALKSYTPSAVYPYHNAKGEVIAKIIRLDFKDGSKVTMLAFWCKLKDGSMSWCLNKFKGVRPLYNLHLLQQNPDAHVLIVEGEKAADAANKLLPLPSYVASTWQGGAKAYNKTDFIPLAGRNILEWPDNDEIGEQVMLSIADLIADASKGIKILKRDTEKPKGWDAADALAEGWTTKTTMDWARKHAVEFKKTEAKKEPPPKTKEKKTKDNKQGAEALAGAPFRFLGYDKNRFFYLPQMTQQIVVLTASQHSKNNLIVLAPHAWWANKFPSKKGVDWDNAAEALMTINSRTQIFDAHELLRGRGAWLDEGRPVLHTGPKILMNGEYFKPREVPSDFIYEASRGVGIETTEPATNLEANELIKICQSLSWDKPLSAILLAGWCIIAPVCGILRWRPHIWVTGSAASGKTTVLKDIIGKVLGPVAITLDGDTTEAGIRQYLQQDARPVLLDESESNTQKSAATMQDILGLARKASSGGRILKGTMSGVSMSYSVRSCFCFSSINTSVQEYADETRISKLIIIKDKKPGHRERYSDICDHINRVLTKEYSSKMLMRSMANLKTLEANTDTFVKAASRILNSRRMADQMGTMLAGAYLCYSTKEITLEKAIEWIEKQDWTEHLTPMSFTDEQKLLNKLLTFKVQVNHDGRNMNIPIGELAEACLDPHGKNSDGIDREIANRNLKRCGMKFEEKEGEHYFFIANKADPIERMLKDTPWVSDWSRPLREIKGAVLTDTMYFTAGIKQRATRMPMSSVVMIEDSKEFISQTESQESQEESDLFEVNQ